MECFAANCRVCVKRPKEDKGAGGCPHAGTDTFKKLSQLDAHDCGAFRLGDGKAWAKREKRENLAANLGLF